MKNNSLINLEKQFCIYVVTTSHQNESIHA